MEERTHVRCPSIALCLMLFLSLNALHTYGATTDGAGHDE